MSNNTKYSIGIDLGTTNCALAFAPLESEKSASEILPIAQWDTVSTLTELDQLPSFLYRPVAEEMEALRGKTGGDWIVGLIARNQARTHPGRVVQSAKSWLSTPGIDQSTNFLPWGTDQLTEKEKLSPVRASSLILNYLRSTWDDAFPNAKFDDQQITITVPASFDASAQRLTLQAARDAGFPDDVRLLEEPQAAFLRWLETNDTAKAFAETLPDLAKRPQCVLVVDVGGGTSDFSLFEVRIKEEGQLPEISRVAVSDHILLGGDNIDLAMAHVVAELQFDGSLAPEQWSHLIAQCRAIKEEALENPDRDEPFQISIPGRGSGLINTTLTAELTPDDVKMILFEGFYPEVGADEKPERSSAGLREFGLPYARDHAVPRHLADFLSGRPKIDAVLFNGGSLKPVALQEKLTAQIGKWQGSTPAILPNPEPGLAVARGAASYGWLLQHQADRIEAGSARSIFLEVAGEKDNALVCVLPKGTPREEEVVIDSLDLELQANQPVAFQLFTSTRHEDIKAGEVLKKSSRDLHALPPLETVANADGRDTISVHLSAKVNAIGLLLIECVNKENLEERWPLEFILTGKTQTAPAKTARDEPDPVSDEKIEAATHRIKTLFSRDLNKRDKLTTNRLTKSLEKIIERPKNEWDVVLLRKLWETHQECAEYRKLSPDHEEAWLSFAGFLLRPGFGVQFDEKRIDQLWEVEETGPANPGKRIDLARYVLWRRVAGGLSRERQEKLAKECLGKLRGTKKASAEVIRLIGALERLGIEQKREISQLLLDEGKAIAAEGGYSEPYWVALMQLLNRAPLYAGPETVVPSDDVSNAYEALRKLDWKDEALSGIPNLFLRAARQVDNPNIDLPRKLRGDILSKLRKAKVPPPRLAPVQDYIEMAGSDQVSLLGEPLPPGLVLK